MKALRLAAVAIGTVEAIAGLGLCALFLSGSPDPLGKAIASGLPVLVGTPLLLFTAPGLLLGWLNRWLVVALVLELAGPLGWMIVLGQLGP